MKKKKIYSVLFLMFIVLSVILMSVSLVSAQGIWERWKAGTLEGLDAKILILILVAVIILVILVVIGLNTGLSLLISIPTAFLLTAFVTPASVLGIFKSYEAVPLTIATIFPLLIFFGLTYISVEKESRTLMTLQVLAWGVFFFYILIKLSLFLFVNYVNTSFFLLTSLAKFFFGTGGGTSVPKIVTSEGSYFLISLMIQGVIAGIMTFWNGGFMNLMLKHTAGVKEIKVGTTLKGIERGTEFLTGAGNIAAGQPPKT